MVKNIELNREQLREKIKSSSLKSKTIFIKEWDTNVTIKELSSGTYLEIYNKSKNNINSDDIDTTLAVNLIRESVYIDNELVFDKDDDLILSLSTDLFGKLINEVNIINNLEEKTKNSKNLLKTI